MPAPLKLLLVAGARPNFMKVAPLIGAIQRHNRDAVNGTRAIDYALVHTGQHYDANMSEVFFRELGIPKPDFCLEAGSGSHAAQTAGVMIRFEPVLLEVKPDWVVVVGDVNSTVACALVATKLGIKVAHVEAGLRSFDRSMPEEINRIVTDSICDLLLTPSRDADENLKKEGIPDKKIRLVGNIMIDALVANLERARKTQVLTSLAVKRKAFVYATLHRPSNVDKYEDLKTIMTVLSEVSRQMPVVFPVHPRTRKMLEEFRIPFMSNQSLKILPPLGYHESICLTESARLVLTDSGGLQEESTFFKTPCLTLRPNTERPVTVTLGSNRLTSLKSLSADIAALLNQSEELGQVPPLWDGDAATRILEALFE
jgi:UDP-N-acetylglucosamine 2-epimerase (non-hydrolysing)